MQPRWTQVWRAANIVGVVLGVTSWGVTIWHFFIPSDVVAATFKRGIVFPGMIFANGAVCLLLTLASMFRVRGLRDGMLATFVATLLAAWAQLAIWRMLEGASH